MKIIESEPIIDIGCYLINLGEKVWKLKRKEMKCLWNECDNMAKCFVSEKLLKCKGCLVARYCSKSCQKNDWKYGYHKEICKKLVKVAK